MCSAKMFCPKKKGFFPYMHQQVRATMNEDDWAAFDRLATCRERVGFVLRMRRLDPAHRDSLFRVVRPLHGEKSRKRSEEAREGLQIRLSDCWLCLARSLGGQKSFLRS